MTDAQPQIRDIEHALDQGAWAASLAFEGPRKLIAAAEINAGRKALLAVARASRTRPDYDLRCQECGAPHWFDTSLPSRVWNQIARPEDLLCLLCIDERLTNAGLECEAEFYFVGSALLSKLYANPETPNVCCEWHNKNCEPPSELCCDDCSERDHPNHPWGPCIMEVET